MDAYELEKKYCIDSLKLEQLESLGLLNHIHEINGKKDYQNSDVAYITEMISLMDLGMSNDKIQCFYQNTKAQKELLKEARYSILEKIHGMEEKIDMIDYMIYKRD